MHQIMIQWLKILEVLIEDLPGATNQTCCFLHILNLLIKSILKQFDLPKPKEKKKLDNNDEGDGSDKTMDQAVEELLKLAGEVEIEGEMMANEEDEDGNHEGWIDECEELSEDELRDLSISVDEQAPCLAPKNAIFRPSAH